MPLSHPFANVNGVLNGVFIQGNAVGEQFMSGRGAGSEATASAVIADLIEIIHNQQIKMSAPSLGFRNSALKSLPIIDQKQFSSNFYINVQYIEDADSNALIEQLNVIAADTLKSPFEIKLYKENQSIIILTEKTVEESVEKLINNAMLNESVEAAKFIRIEAF